MEINEKQKYQAIANYKKAAENQQRNSINLKSKIEKLKPIEQKKKGNNSSLRPSNRLKSNGQDVIFKTDSGVQDFKHIRNKSLDQDYYIQNISKNRRKSSARVSTQINHSITNPDFYPNLSPNGNEVYNIESLNTSVSKDKNEDFGNNEKFINHKNKYANENNMGYDLPSIHNQSADYTFQSKNTDCPGYVDVFDTYKSNRNRDQPPSYNVKISSSNNKHRIKSSRGVNTSSQDFSMNYNKKKELKKSINICENDSVNISKNIARGANFQNSKQTSPLTMPVCISSPKQGNNHEFYVFCSNLNNVNPEIPKNSVWNGTRKEIDSKNMLKGNNPVKEPTTTKGRLHMRGKLEYFLQKDLMMEGQKNFKSVESNVPVHLHPRTPRVEQIFVSNLTEDCSQYK